MPASDAAVSPRPRRTALCRAPTAGQIRSTASSPTRSSTRLVARFDEYVTMRAASHRGVAVRPTRRHTSSSWSWRRLRPNVAPVTPVNSLWTAISWSRSCPPAYRAASTATFIVLAA
jgi:hypothetical protein